ncbi:MAG TPA: hypothetical protein VMV93_05485 [Chloroflexota bacterium]|nr:hypothetical protein [Chloroflexota bacterium]
MSRRNGRDFQRSNGRDGRRDRRHKGGRGGDATRQRSQPDQPSSTSRGRAGRYDEPKGIARRRGRQDVADDTAPEQGQEAWDPGAPERNRRRGDGAYHPRWRREASPHPATCLECINLVIARSRAKAIGESWDQATVYPSYSCYEQRWTVDDPDSVRDLAEVTPYLVGDAEKCPTFLRGSARDFRRGYW